jgi:predicted aspartyl protease
MLLGFYDVTAFAQSGSGSSSPLKATCVVNKNAPSDAEAALSREEYATALDLFGKMAATAPDESRSGTIRTLLEQSKVSDAEAQAHGWVKEQPTNAHAVETLGEVLFRKGMLEEAYRTNQSAMALDRCMPRAYLMDSAYEDVTANFAFSKKHIDVAHALAPNDPEIRWAWMRTLSRKRRLEEEASLLTDAGNLLNARDTARLKDNLEHAKDGSRDECSVSVPTATTTIPIKAIMDGPNWVQGLALDVYFNGKRRRLEIDTGAGGLVLSRGAAAGLGLLREEKTFSGGIGDKGEVATSIAHVESVRIGNLEFHHCAVEILEKRSALDIDGLIGGNVFSKFLLTLDFPKQQLRLDSLPPRPGEKPAALESLNTVEDRPAEAGGESGDSEEPKPHDRYIAPVMKDWTPVYRVGHELLLPMRIGSSAEKLFIVDTGSDSMLISPDAAREVTKVHTDSSTRLSGISGEVNKVYETGEFTLSFAHLQQHVENMTSIDTTKISHDTGVEVSGFLGATILQLLTVHIDYRDNLMKFDYDPKAIPVKPTP